MGIVEGLTAGTGFALQLVALNQLEHADPAGGLWIAQLVSFAVLGPLVFWTRTSLRIGRGLALRAAAVGCFAVLALLFYMLATRHALLGVVIVALYPALPVILSVLLLRERLTTSQTIGLAITAAALTLLGLN